MPVSSDSPAATKSADELSRPLPKAPADVMAGEAQPASVIIPVFGDGHHLTTCVESLLSTRGRHFEIVLIDDGSPEPIRDFTGRDGIRCYRSEKNHGPSHALNRGLEETEGRWVILLNSDVRVLPDSLETLVQALEKHGDFDFAVSKLLKPTEPELVDCRGDGILIGGGGYRIGHGEPDGAEPGEVRAVLGAAGTASVYRRSVLEELGDFDEDFFGFLEDLDLSLRAQLRGHACLYVPTSVVYHEGGVSFRALGDREIFRLITRNQIWVVVKNYPAATLLRALPRLVVFQVLWMALMVWRGYFSSYLRGIYEALRGLPRMLRKRAEIQNQRRISPRRFWELLQLSEAQIADWQRRQPKRRGSLLLRVYFGLFGWPQSTTRS